MKQIYLDLADSTFKQILMELEVLHKSRSPFIVDFYGAFFVDCCVYYCMEYMNAGSLDRLYCNAVNEAVLGKIAFSVFCLLFIIMIMWQYGMIMQVISGLKFLVDEFSVMHRDVRPSNILVNRHGHVKLCDVCCVLATLFFNYWTVWSKRTAK
jgi:mitogen-activated protein kinase kinase